jgi:hypothetical protein
MYVLMLNSIAGHQISYPHIYGQGLGEFGTCKGIGGSEAN